MTSDIDLRIDHHYDLHFYLRALKGILRPQSIQLPPSLPSLTRPVRVTDELRRAWLGHFGIGREAVEMEFPYYWKVVESFFLNEMLRLGLNYRNVLHLGRESRHFSRAETSAGRTYRLSFRLADIAVLDRDRVVFVGDSTVEGPEGTVCSARDYMFVKNVDRETLARLGDSTTLNRVNVSHLRGLSRREPAIRERGTLFRVSATAGTDYGRLSGDKNPIHTSAMLARLFGYPAPFVQGMWTYHEVQKILLHDLDEPLTRLELAFCRPLFLGQTAELRLAPERFEVVDAEGRLVAVGSRSHR